MLLTCSDYYGFKDLEYMFGDLDDYYKPIQARESFDGNYQMYTCRGQIDSTPINHYLAKLRPYLVTILDDKKRFTNKIQLDVAINLKHLTKRHIISFHVKSNYITCTPTDNTDDILNELMCHFYIIMKKKLSFVEQIPAMYSIALTDLVCISIKLI